eukprot:symbB.v1.2.011031.t1/scaffold733.1/size168030/2
MSTTCCVGGNVASGEEPEEKENPFELFAETEILAEDCLGLVAQTIFRQNLSFGEHLEGVLFFFRLFATGPTGWPRSGINLAEPCAAALMTSSAWTDARRSVLKTGQDV